MKSLSIGLCMFFAWQTIQAQTYGQPYTPAGYLSTYRTGGGYQADAYRLYESPTPCITCSGCLPDNAAVPTLPLLWHVLEARRVEARRVHVSWTLEMGGTLAHTHLERKVEGEETFRSIASFSGPEGGHMTYQDVAASPDMGLYRLRLVDADGGVFYSSTQQVRPWHTQLRLYAQPNPFSQIVAFSTPEPITQTGTLILTDMQGRVVWHRRVQAGTQQWRVEAELPAGLYRADLRLPSGRAGTRIVRQ